MSKIKDLNNNDRLIFNLEYILKRFAKWISKVKNFDDYKFVSDLKELEFLQEDVRYDEKKCITSVQTILFNDTFTNRTSSTQEHNLTYDCKSTQKYRFKFVKGFTHSKEGKLF